MKTFVALLALSAIACVAFADDDYGKDYKAPSYNGKTPEGYFQYANVPGEHEYEFGFNRGNANHHISRYEQAKDWRFRTRVKWADNYAGYGEHYYEYNHGHHEPEYKEPAYAAPAYSPPAYSPPAYSPPASYPAPSYQAGGYSAPEPAYAPAPNVEVPEYAKKP